MKWRSSILKWPRGPLMTLACSTALLAGPRAMLPGGNQVNLGRFPTSIPPPVQIGLKNAGDLPLEIRSLRTSCGCLKLTASQNRLPAGETSLISASMNPESVQGVFTKKFFIETNDPEHHLLIVELKGEALIPVDIKPYAKVHLGRLVASQPIKQEFILTEKSGPLHLGRPQVDSPFPIQVEVASNSSEKHRVICHLAPDLPRKEFHAQIILPILEPKDWGEVRLEITGGVELPPPNGNHAEASP